MKNETNTQKENEQLKEEIAELKTDPSQASILAGRVSKLISEKKELQALNAELLEALKGIVEPMRGALYCEYCDRHAPKDEHGKLTGESLTHAEDCPMVSAQSAISKAESKNLVGS